MGTALTRRAILGGAIGATAVMVGAYGGGALVAASGGNRNTEREEARMALQANKDLWTPWLALWNGDLSVADALVTPDFVTHFAPAGNSPGEVRGAEGLKQWIGGILAAFDAPRFSTDIGPLADGDKVVGRWIFRATYRGGIPGAAPDAVGRRVEYAGVDILRVESGMIAEYWLTADVLHLLQQVGVIPS